jgi:6-phosphogluconolactonase
LDRTLIYTFDVKSGRLEPAEEPWVAVKAGAGPRHLVFHPNGRYAYLINELDSTIAVFKYDSRKGKLLDIQTISTLPEDYHGTSTCADVHVSPSGKYLYGSNRGHDSIVVYKIDQTTGLLHYIAHESTRGNTPRNFAIDPAGNFLLAANQDSDTIVTFIIDPQSGQLRPSGQITGVPTPVCVKIIPRHRE